MGRDRGPVHSQCKERTAHPGRPQGVGAPAVQGAEGKPAMDVPTAEARTKDLARE